MRILLVDDEASIAELLGGACALDGHDVATCTAVDQALEHLERHPVDLLVSDIVMPGLDGLSLVRRARELQPELMAVVITGHASRYGLDEAMAAGASDLMYKPFRIQELRARVALAEERLQVIDSLNARRKELRRAS